MGLAKHMQNESIDTKRREKCQRVRESRQGTELRGITRCMTKKAENIGQGRQQKTEKDRQRRSDREMN